MPTVSSLFNRSYATLLVARDSGEPSGLLINLMIALMTLLFVALLLLAVLVVVRRMRVKRQMREDTLPRYNDAVKSSFSCPPSPSSSPRNHRRLTIQTADGRSSVLVFQDGGRHASSKNNQQHPMLINPNSPPHSPDNIPEIHITFPDEHDELGHRRSGRVVVVRVGDGAAAAVGLEPLQDEEQLPAYEKESSAAFFSLDLDKIGGLKEKDRIDWH